MFTASHSNANEKTYAGLVKRNIKEKIIEVEGVMKKSKLAGYRTISVVFNEHIVYCHYKKQNEKNLPLIICY
jgi:uncharacterized membrane protein